MFVRFDVMHERDGRTDGRTLHDSKDVPRLCIASRGKNDRLLDTALSNNSTDRKQCCAVYTPCSSGRSLAVFAQLSRWRLSIHYIVTSESSTYFRVGSSIIARRITCTVGEDHLDCIAKFVLIFRMAFLARHKKLISVM